MLRFRSRQWRFAAPTILQRKYSFAQHSFKSQPKPSDYIHASSSALTPMARPSSASEPSLICNEIDAEGRLHVSCGKILKSTLCASYGIQPRDLRKLDGTLKNQLPVILVRSSAILVNLGMVKAIIRYNGVTLFEGLELEERLMQQQYITEIQTKLKTNLALGLQQQPFEFVVLETILQKTLQSLQDE